MDIIFTDDEFEVRWMNMKLSFHGIFDRDIWHLATLADMECYEQYCEHIDEGLGFYWKDMSHIIKTELDPIGESVMFVLLASNDYFEDREIVKVRVYKDRKGAEITFGRWMDTETLRAYQDVFREWMDTMKKVTEERV